MEMLEADWRLIGHNVHTSRLVRGMSQEEFAHRTGLSITTIYRIEKGLPIRQKSLRAITLALDYKVENLRERRQTLLTEETGPLSHRWPETIWTVADERRAKVPVDDFLRIQDPQERIRLGRLGLVGSFMSSMSFIMPDGPGPNFYEYFLRSEDTINEELYRDALIFCVAGHVRLGIGGRTITLGPGDVAGYRTRELEWIVPAAGSELPVRLTWVGAVRIGLSPPHEVQAGQRAKRRRKEAGKE